MALPRLLIDRQTASRDRLSGLSEEIARLPDVTSVPNLCLYVTGSYGRLEASQVSDLDLFFIQTGDTPESDMSRITTILMSSDVIRLARTQAFPEFSRDGAFLEIHQLRDILEHLGSPEDDSRNFFTARMLLLLESRAVHNLGVYRTAINRIVEAYFRDYHDHERDFKPVFLANDLVRFWKTLCLNYEHRRNRPTNDEAKKAASHLKNLQLKYSRMSTCFSSIIWLAAQSEPPGPDRVLEMVQLTPMERFERIAEMDMRARPIVQRLQENYVWFLETTGKPKQEVLDWILDRSNRSDAFERARKYGAEVFELLMLVAEGKNLLRYLLV